MLTAVRRIARQRLKINSTYVTAVVEARESGVTYASIAEAVGTSSQAVQEIVRRHNNALQREQQAKPEQSNGAPAGAIAAAVGEEEQSSAGGSVAGGGGPAPSSPGL
ncbi:hypothetical protein GCM10023159_15660 [Brevibacterium yomogidense]